MSYAGSYSGGYDAGYGGGMNENMGMSATIEAPPTKEVRGPKQEYLQEFFQGGEADEYNPRTLYVGNLDISISEEFLVQLFGSIGPITKCKIIHEAASDPYAFVEFQENIHAVQALTAMNKRNLLGKEMKVNWATSPGQQQNKVDTSKHYHVFIGDLSPEIDIRTLREAFAPFGVISDVKVIKDLNTMKSKGYGFVSFVEQADAERAIEQMNGQWLGRRAIRTNWASRKPPGADYQTGGGRTGKGGHTLDEILQQAAPGNTTVYVGNVGGNTSDDDLRQVFVKYGNVTEVRVFRQQGYAFVKYGSKDEAAQAIYNVSGTEINGSTVRCSWGKEGGYASNSMYPNYGYGYGYGYGPAGNHEAQQQQPSQAAQGNQNYWNQYYHQYYNNPAAYQQQWQAYYQQQGHR